jgi:DNA-binding transcriptional MerR regulator
MNRAILLLMKKGGGAIGKDLMRIGELAKRSGVSTRTIDYYTNFGLLDVQRSESNYRLYPLSTVQTIERIQLLKKQRLTISEIKETLQREETINSEALAESVFEEFKSLQQKIARLEEQLEEAPTHVKLQISKALENRMGALASLISLL